MDIQTNPAIDWRLLLQSFRQGDMKALARTISLIENDAPGYLQLLEELPAHSSPGIIGITGPPGAGKSTLVDGLIGQLIEAGKKVGVLCVDPSSPFHHGALLGDRIRMSEWYNHPRVFIRSLTTRGSLGGLHPKMIEISDLLKAADFDQIIVETVGVGQSEIEIAGLADTTVVTLVPEAGDEIQIMKAGLMEIADIFVINKSDRPGADDFVKNLLSMLAPAFNASHRDIPVIKTIASQKVGLTELMEKIREQQKSAAHPERKSILLAEKAYQLIARTRMKNISRKELRESIQSKINSPDFNLYKFVSSY